MAELPFNIAVEIELTARVRVSHVPAQMRANGSPCSATVCWWARDWCATDKTPYSRPWTALITGEFPRSCLEVPTYLLSQRLN